MFRTNGLGFYSNWTDNCLLAVTCKAFAFPSFVHRVSINILTIYSIRMVEYNGSHYYDNANNFLWVFCPFNSYDIGAMTVIVLFHTFTFSIIFFLSDIWIHVKQVQSCVIRDRNITLSVFILLKKKKKRYTEYLKPFGISVDGITVEISK